MVAVAIGAAAVVGAGASIVSGNNAASAQRDAAQQASETERYMYDTTRSDYAPYRQVGQGALYKLADMYGISRPQASATVQPAQTQSRYGVTGWNNGVPIDGNAPAMSMTTGYEGFQASPGYQFRKQEGLDAIKANMSARGLLGSTATSRLMDRYAEGLASQEYDAYANRLAGLAGIGQSATGSTAAAGSQAAGAIGQAQMAAGNARASSYANTGSAINNGLTNLASAYMYNQQGGFKPVNYGMKN